MSTHIVSLNARRDNCAPNAVDRHTSHAPTRAAPLHVLSISRRVLERERSAGRFPAPDLIFGRMHLWRPERIQAGIDNGGVA
jgi:hypothetical protein